MNGLQLAALLLVLYTGALGGLFFASALVPRVRAWYAPHVRAFAFLFLVAIAALFVEIGAIVTR